MRVPPYKCLRCGLLNPMGSTTCQSCGASLTGATQPTPSGVGPSGPTRGRSPAPTQPQGTGRGRTPRSQPTAVAVPATPTAAPTSARSSALDPFGWKSIDGRVIHVEPVFMGMPDSRWGLFFLKWAILGLVIYSFGAALIMPLALLLAFAWIVARMFRGGFLSAVAVQVTSFMLTRKLLGPTANIPVRDFRVRDSSGEETLVRMKGQLVSGNLTVGDDVTVEGWMRSGMLVFRKGYNSRIRARIQVR